MTKLSTPPSPRQRLVFLAMRRGADRVTMIVAPALRVVREPGKPPRVEVDSSSPS